MSNPCPHKTLVRKNSGGLSWYVCANPDCDATKVKGNPQKFKAVEWDGQVRSVSPAGTGQPEPTHGAMCWNGNLQSNGTVYDDATLIQIMRGEALKYRAEFQLLQEAGVRMPSQQAVMERIKLISDLERGDSVKGEGETAND